MADTRRKQEGIYWLDNYRIRACHVGLPVFGYPVFSTMKNLFRVPYLALLFVAVALLSLSSCASGKKQHPMGYISKANIYHLEPGVRIETEDQMIRFEYMHRIRGAVESTDYLARYGNYITVFWQGVDKSSNVSVRLEYRQAKTGSTVMTMEMTPDKVRWKNTTDFEVVGEVYTQNGPVTGWRAILLVNGAEADVYESFLWQ